MNFGKQYRQGNRVYDSNAVAMCLNASPVGNMGGCSYLYTIGAAMRGRYDSDGKISQQIEVSDDELSNCITSVQKDSLVVEVYSGRENEGYIYRRYREFYEKNGYLPQYFVPYNCKEVIDYAPTLATECGTPGHISNVLIIENHSTE